MAMNSQSSYEVYQDPMERYIARAVEDFMNKKNSPHQIKKASQAIMEISDYMDENYPDYALKKDIALVQSFFSDDEKDQLVIIYKSDEKKAVKLMRDLLKKRLVMQRYDTIQMVDAIIPVLANYLKEQKSKKQRSRH